LNTLILAPETPEKLEKPDKYLYTLFMCTTVQVFMYEFILRGYVYRYKFMQKTRLARQSSQLMLSQTS